MRKIAAVLAVAGAMSVPLGTGTVANAEPLHYRDAEFVRIAKRALVTPDGLATVTVRYRLHKRSANGRDITARHGPDRSSHVVVVLRQDAGRRRVADRDRAEELLADGRVHTTTVSINPHEGSLRPGRARAVARLQSPKDWKHRADIQTVEHDTRIVRLVMHAVGK